MRPIADALQTVFVGKRSRVAVVALGVLLVGLLLKQSYFFYREALGRYQRLSSDADWFERVVPVLSAGIARAKAGAGSGEAASLLSVVTAQVDAVGLKIERADFQGNESLVVSFEPAIFEDLISLLVALELDSRVRAEVVAITMEAEPGLCKARVTFGRNALG